MWITIFWVATRFAFSICGCQIFPSSVFSIWSIKDRSPNAESRTALLASLISFENVILSKEKISMPRSVKLWLWFGFLKDTVSVSHFTLLESIVMESSHSLVFNLFVMNNSVAFSFYYFLGENMANFFFAHELKSLLISENSDTLSILCFIPLQTFTYCILLWSEVLSLSKYRFSLMWNKEENCVLGHAAKISCLWSIPILKWDYNSSVHLCNYMIKL